MGCWNGTCFITNLAIRANESVALILITSKDCDLQINQINGGGIVHSNAFFKPIPYAFYGAYDDYGSIDECDEHSSEVIKALFPTIPEKIFDALERGEHEATKSWSFVMVKKQVFDLLVSEIGKRVPYGSKLNLYDDTYQAVQKSLSSKKKNYLRSRELMEYWNDSFQLDNYVKTTLFIDAVTAMRKLWFPQAGAGSQANERYLYHAVGKLAEEIYQKEKDVLLKEYQEHPEWFDKNISSPDYQHGAETVFSRLKYLER